MKTKVTSLLLLSLFASVPLLAKTPATHRNVAYHTEDKAQALDVYLAKSDKPTPVVVFIHGGGWRGGSKNAVPPYLLDAVVEGWTSVVSVEYRFTDVATHPAQVNDCARAIQFVRSKAKEWNLDAKRIAVTGGSAGAHLALWLALHDDFANSKSDDPVERESSRVSCAIGFAGPTDWSLLSEIDHKHPAYRQLLNYEPGTAAAEMDAEKKANVSPITFASKDDPPILIVHGDADVIVPVRHARDLDERMEQAEADSDLLIIEGGNHSIAGARHPKAVKESVAFLKEHLLAPKKK
jgi:acetyl esterase/lipase